MAEKLCVFCKNLEYEPESVYSGYIMEGAGMNCTKQHWPIDSFKKRSKIVNVEYDLTEFRKAILIGKDCSDYDEAKP